MKKLSKQMMSNLIVTAVEGGSNYWYLFDKEATKQVRKYKGVKHETNEYNTFSEAILVALDKGESILVSDIESEEILGVLTKKGIYKATELLHDNYPSVYGNIITDNWDMNDADAWFQLAVMGEVKFG